MSWGKLALRTASHGVVFEGEASPAPGGGSMLYQFASVPVTTAQILAWDSGDFSTYPELLPALGGRKYYVLHNVVVHYRFGTTPFNIDSDIVGITDDGTLKPYWAWTDDGSFGIPWHNIQNDMYAFLPPNKFGLPSDTNQADVDDIENAALLAYLGTGPFTGGDGALVFRLFYGVIDAAS